MISFSVDPAERRRTLRFAIQHSSRLRFTLDGGTADSEEIDGLTLTDISQQGLMAAGAGELVPGAHILLEVPLVGWREVEVMWIAENRAGCRFVRPLSFEELRLAAATSERLALECPSLADDISHLPALSDADDGRDVGERPGWRPWWAILGLGLILLAAAALLLLR